MWTSKSHLADLKPELTHSNLVSPSDRKEIEVYFMKELISNYAMTPDEKVQIVKVHTDALINSWVKD